MKEIKSTANESVKHIVKLQTKSHRDKHQQFIAQGARTCTTLIDQGYQAIGIYLTEQIFFQADSAKFDQNIITVVSDEVMKKISTTATPSGILVVFEKKIAQATPTSNSIVLYNIQDPGNLGTLIRTAASMNIQTIYLIEGVDPYNPKVVQSTAGTIAHVNIIQTDWDTFAKQHQSFQTCALVVENGTKPQDLNIADSIIVIGNEAQGLPEKIIQSCTQKLTIPMPGNTESLNAAVAGSIAMYLKIMV